jgi:cyclophilin family peptidyl-prolyl cis-trans isomerase
LVYRQFPLITIHDKALITSEAAEAAGALGGQDGFWKMHDLLFTKQQEWSAKTAEEMPAILSGYAKELNLDTKAFDEAISKETYKDKVMAAYNDATAAQLPGTPSIVIDGVHYPSQWGFSSEALDVFMRVIEMKRRQLDVPPSVIQKGKQYQATITTDKGDIVVDLFADKAPVTVNSFVYLAQKGWFDNILFHRVIPGFVAQAGDPTATGFGWPGYQCSDELTPDLTFDGPGVLAMANSGPDTNGSQFFITLAAQPSLNGKHTIFGKVVKGMEVADALAARDPQQGPLDQPGDHILKITISEK